MTLYEYFDALVLHIALPLLLIFVAASFTLACIDRKRKSK